MNPSVTSVKDLQTYLTLFPNIKTLEVSSRLLIKMKVSNDYHIHLLDTKHTFDVKKYYKQITQLTITSPFQHSLTFPNLEVLKISMYLLSHIYHTNTLQYPSTVQLIITNVYGRDLSHLNNILQSLQYSKCIIYFDDLTKKQWQSNPISSLHNITLFNQHIEKLDPIHNYSILSTFKDSSFLPNEVLYLPKQLETAPSRELSGYYFKQMFIANRLPLPNIFSSLHFNNTLTIPIQSLTLLFIVEIINNSSFPLRWLPYTITSLTLSSVHFNYYFLDFQSFNCLKYISLNNLNITGFSLPKHITTLIVTNCNELRSFPNVTLLQRLISLVISSMKNIKQILVNKQVQIDNPDKISIIYIDK
ncbi:Leucine-rich repeat containing protein [Entamoeba marina]